MVTPNTLNAFELTLEKLLGRPIRNRADRRKAKALWRRSVKK